MFNNIYDDAPAPRKSSAPATRRGRTSTAYLEDPPTLTLQEPTPQLSQEEFLTPKGSPDYRQSEREPPTSSHKGKTPVRHVTPTSPGPFSTLSSRPTTPESQQEPSEHATPRQLTTRRPSIPVRPVPIRSPSLPAIHIINCDTCKSTHEIATSHNGQVTIHRCSTIPPSPQVTPSILEMYHLPGYLTQNPSGQIIVKTESELLSYVRKIFVPASDYLGDFPKDRMSNIGSFDSKTQSTTSTPDSARASFYLGHSKYRGKFTAASQSTTQKTSAAHSNVTSSVPSRVQSPPPPVPPTQEEPSVSLLITRPTIEKESTPSTIHDVEPVGHDHSRHRSISPTVQVRTATPIASSGPRQSSPSHATASRRASPRNLRSIGIFSDTDTDTEAPPLPRAFELSTEVQTYIPRSRSASESRYHTRTAIPAELYSIHSEISQELQSEPSPSGLAASRYATSSSTSEPRGRDPHRRQANH